MEDFPIITTEELQKKLETGETLHLVDVREDEEVAQGMIPGAKHVKMMEIPARLNEFDRETEYIVICRSGGRSSHVCHFMQEQGYKVRNMVGGMLEWRGKVE
ncbi:rhodanese-like domain-containing protein [Niallia sp. Krafla_26]|uniref:rhodanese-like domain-containing protein n=1 Tax=Niallia sp. Krafla_26 TaxID=3064703 RepID=UPI003D170305